MKTLITITAAVSLALPAGAAFEKWTNKEGRVAELELVEVTGEGSEKTGTFKMRNGRTVSIKMADLVEADAKRLDEWKPEAAAEEAKPSVFDSHLNGNLVKLRGRSLRPMSDFEKPTKYYLFYYTASWCGPCVRFTPNLVKFYDTHKPDNKEFEIILISSDSDGAAMDKYASEKKMTWPHLKHSRIDRFKREVKHPGRGIPNLVLTDLDGKILSQSYVDGNYVGPTVVMNHLGELLKK